MKGLHRAVDAGRPLVTPPTKGSGSTLVADSIISRRAPPLPCTPELGHQVAWSAGIEALVGLPEGAFDGTFAAYERVLHPDDGGGAGRHPGALDDESVTYEIEHRVVAPDGVTRWLACRGHVVRDEGRRPTRMLGVVWDGQARRPRPASRSSPRQVGGGHRDQPGDRPGPQRGLSSWRRAASPSISALPLRLIGLCDEASARSGLLAALGHEDGYLDENQVLVGSTETGRGPTALALADGSCTSTT